MTHDTMTARNGNTPPHPEDNSSINTILKELDQLGVQLVEPHTPSEIAFADALDAFSHFVLCEEPERCQSIIDKHVHHGSGGAGLLQGGSDAYDIYRITIQDEHHDDHDDHNNVHNNPRDNNNNASFELMREFLMSNQGKQYKSILTIGKLKSYMLGMCERRTRKQSQQQYPYYEYQHECQHECQHEHTYHHDDDEYAPSPTRYTTLGNLMFILSFGPTNGQVRHIDDMSGNVQICLYMSEKCATTLVYALGGSPITNVQQLIDYWNSTAKQHQHQQKQQASPKVPELLVHILTTYQHVPLSQLRSAHYFSHLGSLHTNVERFGKLYRPVRQTLGLPETDPGTTLIAGGNEVHAGPPTKGPRMFAFAIGIPETKNNHPPPEQEGHDDGNNIMSEENNDGEVQYSPVLFHIDMCCILFGIMTYEFEFPLPIETTDTTEQQQQQQQQQQQYMTVKRFLLEKLLKLLQEYPTETYSVHFADDRKEVREWIEQMVHVLHSKKNTTTTVTTTKVNSLLQQAIESETMFYDPHILKLLKKKKKKKKKMKKMKNRTTFPRMNKNS